MIGKRLRQEFARAVGSENLFAGEADRLTYGYDAAVLPSQMPALVVRPNDEASLSAVVRLCHENGLPLTVRGAGTNLSGGTIPHASGVVVLTTGMNRILEVNCEDLYAVVEPGVITAKLAAAVEDQQLFYPPDPGSQAVSTLGGNVAENAGGLRGLKYGVTRDYLLGLRFLDASGELVVAGSRTLKCVTGYNLTDLMAGSEGTLGVFSQLTLKLVPLPKTKQALLVEFAEVDPASETVAAIIAERIVPVTLEYLDRFTIRAVEDFSHAGLPVDAAALLLIEMDGHPLQVEEEANEVAGICRAMGARSVHHATNEAERDRVWEARRMALSALAKIRPTLVLEDATVPRSKIPAMVRAIDRIQRTHALTIGVFGHAGDGNLHPTICTDRRDRAEWQRVEAAIEAIFDEALALGGTLSGEHGIGLAKARYLAKEVTPATLAYAQRLKAAVDPQGILNPGKILGTTQ